VYNLNMLSWLKRHFIPHEGNNHRPHILRTPSMRNIVVVVVFFEIFTFLIPTLARINMEGGMAAVLPAVLASLTNQERQANNLKTLKVDPLLNKAAQMKATDMATHGYFAHISPTGKTPWYWLEKAGYKYQYAGENLAINFSDSKDVTSAWMASPTHRANIEKKNYTEIGTGVASGIYKGQKTIFVAQVYANPLPKNSMLAKSSPTNNTKIIKEVALNPIKQKSPNVLGIEEVNTTKQKSANVLKTEKAKNTNNNNLNLKKVTASVVSLKPIANPTFFQKLVASPRNTTDMVLYIVFGIVFIALLLYIFIKMRNHHRDLITNLAIIGAIFVINFYLTNHKMVSLPTINYSNTMK